MKQSINEKRLLKLLAQPRPSNNQPTDYWFVTFLKQNTRVPFSIYRNKNHKPMAAYYNSGGDIHTLFIAHWDTVDGIPLEPMPYKPKKLEISKDKQGDKIVSLSKEKVINTVHSFPYVPLSTYTRNVLGADDGAGVELVISLAETTVNPGYGFLLVSDEEVGGKGTKWLLKNNPEIFARVKRAISLDRKGYTDVISEQGWQETASEAFCYALGKAIGMGYTPSFLGTFTDSELLVEVIPECTNLSVGYSHAHTSDEQLNISHLDRLYKALVSVEYESLKPVRAKGKSYRNYRRYGRYGGYTYTPKAKTVQNKSVVKVTKCVNDHKNVPCSYCGLHYQIHKMLIDTETGELFCQECSAYANDSSKGAYFDDCELCGSEILVSTQRKYEGSWYKVCTSCAKEIDKEEEKENSNNAI